MVPQTLHVEPVVCGSFTNHRMTDVMSVLCGNVPRATLMKSGHVPNDTDDTTEDTDDTDDTDDDDDHDDDDDDDRGNVEDEI